MKYVDATVTFREIPGESNLCISISGCKIHCKDCHSKYLWDDIGTELTIEELDFLINKNDGITCICFMGGQISELEYLWFWISTRHPWLKIAWYTGEDNIPDSKAIEYLDYIKVGPYKKEFGALDNPNTNQRFFARGSTLHKMDANSNMFYDITDKFWKNESKDKEIK